MCKSLLHYYFHLLYRSICYPPVGKVHAIHTDKNTQTHHHHPPPYTHTHTPTHTHTHTLTVYTLEDGVEVVGGLVLIDDLDGDVLSRLPHQGWTKSPITH